MRRVLRRFSGDAGRQLIRYLAVGIWNTVFGYSVFAGSTYALTGRIPHAYMVAYAIAGVMGVLSAFVLYKVFVFRTKGNVLREFARVNAVYAGTLLLGFVLLPVLVHALAAVLGALWAPYVAQAVLIPITVCVSFIGHRSFSFRAEGAPAAPAAPGRAAAGARVTGTGRREE